MGVDYNARKAAKRHFKKKASGAADFIGGDKGLKRDRKKRQPSAKRLGVCWGEPTVTQADKQWTDDEDGGDVFDLLEQDGPVDLDAPAQALESNRRKRLKRAVPLKKAGFTPREPAVKLDAVEVKKLKQEQKKLSTADAAAAKVKLSSAVNLLAPTSGQARGKEHEAAAEQGSAGAKAGAKASAKAGKSSSVPALGGPGARPSGTAAADAPAGKKGEQVVTAEALLPFHTVIRTYMALQKFVEPTEVQAAVWAAACDGANVQAQAHTGSGKTLAFALPLAARLVDAGHGRHTKPTDPLALIVSPTRELALQTHAALRPLHGLYGLSSACLYGGVDKAAQVATLQEHPHIVVATPGRLLDLVDDGALSLARVQSVCLDECDKMLGLGFAAQLARLSALLLQPPAAAAAPEGEAAGAPEGKHRAKKARREDVKLVPAAEPAAWARPQVLLFTATMPPEVQEAADVWLRDAQGPAGGAVLKVALQASPLSISPTITQVVQVCAEHKKPAKLLKHLNAIKKACEGMRAPPRVLIFANRVKTVRFVHTEVKKAGFTVVMLHGERSQAERETAIRDFRAGKAQIMVASDVAARGLHVRNLLYIVNYDFPGNLETYIHRVGRTGRLQAYGHAFSFFTRNLARMAPDTVACLQQGGQAVDPNLKQLAESYQTVLAQLGPEGILKLQRQHKSSNEGEDAEEDEDAGVADEDADAGGLFADDLEEGRKGEELPSAGAGVKRKRSAASEAAGTSAKGLLPPVAARPQRKFIASAKFTGKRAGYVFKTGASGTGFYLDSPPAVSAGRSTGKAARGAAVDDDQDLDASRRFMKKGLLSGGSEAQRPRPDSAAKSGAKKKAVPGRLRKKLKLLEGL